MAPDTCEYTMLKEWGLVQPKPPLTDQVSRATSMHPEGVHTRAVIIHTAKENRRYFNTIFKKNHCQTVFHLKSQNAKQLRFVVKCLTSNHLVMNVTSVLLPDQV